MRGAPDTHGVCFTPLALGRLGAERLLGPDPPSARVLDPACGDGALLEAAWRTLVAAGIDGARAAEGLHGIELDPLLVERCRARLRRLVGGSAGHSAAERVLCADALDPAVAWPRATHVLANPPWASLSGRQAVALAPERRRLWLASWPAGASWPSLHGAFLERTARHVHAERTRAELFLPAPVMELERYARLRALVASLARLAGAPERLPHGAFPGVDEPAVLLSLVGGPCRPADGASWWSGPSADERLFLERVERFDPLPPACYGDIGVHTGNARAELLLPLPPIERTAAPATAPATAPAAPPTPPQTPALPTPVLPTAPVAPTALASRVALRASPSPSACVTEPVPGRLVALREGRDLVAFRLAPPRLCVRTDLAPAPGRRFRVPPLERHRAVPILLRQTADRPIAALHSSPTLFRNSLLACTPPDGLAPAALVALLNAEVLARWHRLRFPEARQRSFPQLKVAHLRRLPVPPLSRALARRLARVAERLASAPSPTVERSLRSLTLEAYGLAAEELPVS